jgi:hypothetical protein
LLLKPQEVLCPRVIVTSSETLARRWTAIYGFIVLVEIKRIQ